MPGAVQKVFDFVPLSDRISRKELKNLLENERMSLRGIAKPLGVSRHFVWEAAKKYHLKNRRRHIAKKFTREIVSEKLAGKSAVEIAKTYGISVRRVCAIIREQSEREISAAIYDDGTESSHSVKAWRCPRHGLVKFRPCVACLAEGHADNGAGR